MPAWDCVLDEIRGQEKQASAALDTVRKKYISKLAAHRNRNVICYYSGWLQKNYSAAAASIGDDDMNGFMNAVHGCDKNKGLDLILHTPGGDVAATESIVSYLKECFGLDIVAIVPQLAMSAGTMMCCACKKILMGKQSSLGPTDPQLGGVPAAGVIEEFENACREANEDPSSVLLWKEIIGKYHPTFLGECQKALEASQLMVKSWLKDNMFKGNPDADQIVEKIAGRLCDHKESAMHNRHLSYRDVQEIGLSVDCLEGDDETQDLVLTVHHAFMNTFSMSTATKIIESSAEKCWISSSVPK